MAKGLEYLLYILTIMYGFVLAGFNVGDSVYVSSYLAQRAGFYLAEVLFLAIVWIRCNKLQSNYNDDYFKETEKLFSAADTCFVMIAIITVFSVAGLLPIFVFLPENVFENGAANGLIVSLLVVGLLFAFYLIVSKRFDIVKKQRGEIKNPLSEKTEDFFAFINSADEKEEPDREEMPDAFHLPEDLVPSREDFQRHMQQIYTPEPKQLWECPYCGSLNTSDSEQCGFCGADTDKSKEDKNNG